MHLQPCDRCGAINKRTAKNCYKCDSGFTHPAEPELDIDPAPAILDKDVASLALKDGDLAREHTPAPLEPAQSASAPPQVYELVSSARAATTSGSSRTWRFVTSAILFAAIAIFVYYSSEQSSPPAKKQPVMQLAPSVSGTLISADATAPIVAPPIVAPPVEAALAPTSTTPKTAVDASELAEPLALASRAVSAAPTVRPSVTTRAEVKTRQDPPIFKDCPQAVAALGLCNPGTKQEK
jgi:hypothetical protein